MTLRWVPGWNGLTEPEAVSYVAAVEAADGEPLEYGVARAINDFVLGCKNDGIWSAIKASCILAGARTLNGALVPLVGAAPTNYNFVSGDYNRSTGLVGDGSTKYLDSNRNNNADPQNSKHVSVHVSTTGTGTANVLNTNAYPFYIGTGGSSSGATGIIKDNTTVLYFRHNSATANILAGGGTATGFVGSNRASSAGFTVRASGANTTMTRTSDTPYNANIGVFRSLEQETTFTYSNARLAFYSIGESLDLALLDARVTTLITAIGAAIP
jgi:hypothetical protein